MLLSPNTQAILLLTAPLMNGRRGDDAPKPLSQGRYRKIAVFLHKRGLSPSDFLGRDADALIDECESSLDLPPLRPLLGRGFQLSQATERWSQRSIWVRSEEDVGYPQRLHQRLGERAPPLLYGCGEPTLLDSGGFAIVGSRNATDDILRYSASVARMAAEAGFITISGGARGVDQAAMQGAEDAGGRVTGVLADGLERAALRREHREPLIEGSMVLCSPYDPQAGFAVGHAMQRNKLVYALSDAALIVNADYQKGGTWTGAVEQLDKLRLVPLFVRAEERPGQAIKALMSKGAAQWPNPQSPEAFRIAIENAQAPTPETVQECLFAGQRSEAAKRNGTSTTLVQDDACDPSAALSELARQLILAMDSPLSEDAVSKRLGVVKTQARRWLADLCEAGYLNKRSHPARYLKSENVS